MENYKHNTTLIPEILIRLEELLKDLFTLKLNGQISPKRIDYLITKLNIIIEIHKYKPRLPLYDLEKEIISLCKKDKSIHGVTVNFLFISKFKNTDFGRLPRITINT